MIPCRVRFAPSPTGALHIGGVRTALYNYLFAKKNKGTFILRIEDTDQTRYVEGAEAYIQQALQWLGISFDEGVGIGGEHAPYRQSERKELYKKEIQQLLNSGHAYYAFDTPEELEQERKKDAAFLYGIPTRMRLKNSLTLSEEETKKHEASGAYVIRFKIPENTTVQFHDIVRGDVSVESAQLDDKVLFKSDGLPTYHFANVVDDHAMKISHVIRGEEWLPSTPLHVLLYRAFGWQDVMPKFCHLPLLLKADGHGKLSKRDADQHGFPIFPLNWNPSSGESAKGFREMGYEPEAVINFLALLGWNSGTEKEIFSMEELIQEFSLERIHKAGARYDIQKANWFNQQYLHQKPTQEIAAYLATVISAQDKQKIFSACELVKERMTFLSDVTDLTAFIFHAPENYDEAVLTKKWTSEAGTLLSAYASAIKSITLTAESAKQHWDAVCQVAAVSPGKYMQLLRLAVSGASSGPDLMKSIELIGAQEIATRIEKLVNSRA